MQTRAEGLNLDAFCVINQMALKALNRRLDGPKEEMPNDIGEIVRPDRFVRAHGR